MRLRTVAFLLVTASCGPQQLCVPGMAQSCYGPGACLGGQMCLLDGSGYSTCNCGSIGVGGGFSSGVGGGTSFGGGSSAAGGSALAGGTAGGAVLGGGSALGGGTVQGGGTALGGGVATGGGAAVGGGTSAGGGLAGGRAGGGTAGGSARTCTISQTCPANACVCGDLAAITSQYCLNGFCQSGPTECARACVAAGHPAPGSMGGGSAGGGAAGGAGGGACNNQFALGSNFTTGSELYVQCNQFPSPTNCLTGKYINFEGLSGPLSACYCYAVCPNGVTEGQQCLSGGDGGLVCHRVQSAAGSSAFMCLPPGPAWQNLCR